MQASPHAVSTVLTCSFPSALWYGRTEEKTKAFASEEILPIRRPMMSHSTEFRRTMIPSAPSKHPLQAIRPKDRPHSLSDGNMMQGSLHSDQAALAATEGRMNDIMARLNEDCIEVQLPLHSRDGEITESNLMTQCTGLDDLESRANIGSNDCPVGVHHGRPRAP